MNEKEILVEETIEEVNLYLPKMINGIDSFILYFENGKEKEQESNTLLSNIFEGLEWITQAVYLINKIKPGPMQEQELVEKLSMLIDAYENEDYLLLCDILDYEIKPVLKKWANQIS